MTIDEAMRIAVGHHQAGQLAEAEQIYRQILLADPSCAEALHLLGVAMGQAGNNAGAVELISRAVAAQPRVPHFQSNLGKFLFFQGKLDAAAAACRRALALKPDYWEAFFNLAEVLKAAGNRAEALHNYREAARCKPAGAQDYFSIAHAMAQLGAADDAIACYRAAIALREHFPEAHNNLGVMLLNKTQADEAIMHFRAAIRIHPAHRGAHNNLGNALLKKGRLEEALAAFATAIEFHPDHAEAHNNLGNALLDRGEATRASSSYRHAMSLHPQGALFASNLIFALNYDPQTTGESLYRETTRLARAIEATVPAPAEPARTPPGPAGRRLRIGYVSPDFRRHAVGYFLLPLLENHDHSRVEVICYSDVANDDDFTRRMRAVADRWRDIGARSHAAVEAMVREDAVDILVDLAGHTSRNRLPLFARKPAPVQVTYLGYPGTTGLAAMDYRLTDAMADPPGMTDLWHSEKLWRLPDIFAVYGTAHEDVAVKPLPALAGGGVTFGSFHTLAKINEELLGWWAQILARVPNSKLLMAAQGLADEGTRRRIAGILDRLGVAAQRVRYVGKQPMRAYLELHNEVDIALDSFPYSGHTIGCEALWMGLPVVTLAGERHCSRMMASVMRCLGMEEWIAQTPQAYVDIAVSAAGDVARLAGVRAGLRVRLERSPAMDAARFARYVEEAYAGMWAERTGGPLAIDATMQTAVAHHQAGRLADAEELYRRVLAAQPHHPGALHLLGVAAGQQGDARRAVDLIVRAIAAYPGDAFFHGNLGKFLRDLGRPDAAEASYREALRLNPDFAEARQNLGNIFADRKRWEEAESFYRASLTRLEGSAEVHSNLGNALAHRGRGEEALVHLRRALELNPRYADGYANLAFALREMGELEEAIAVCRRGVEMRPDAAAIHSQLLVTLHFDPASDAARLRGEHRLWDQRHAAPLAGRIRPHANDPDPARRLRVGYVSTDFVDHAVGRFMLPLLHNHDRAAVEVFCYSDARTEDQVSEPLKRQADVWRSICGLTDDAAAELVRRDGIDILVDLTMHANGNRLPLFARKPAPVQATYLAYCSTTGLSTMDYRLTDRFFDPPGSDESVYSEKSVRLKSYWCYPEGTAAAVGDLPAVAAGHVTFGCLNNFFKVSRGALEVWARLLLEVERARLILHARPGSHRARTLAFLERLGIASGRVQFAELVPREEYFPRYRKIDIALDPFPFGGGTTTCDALWMGVPVVTLRGRTAVGRGGVSILSQIGLPELVAETEADYVRIARELAGDLPRLKELRATMRARMQGSPLMDAAGFARDVEGAYREMWRRWCEKGGTTQR